jgi:Putative restriction endonuclease
MALLKESEAVLMSGEDLFRRPDLGPCELVNGRIVPLPPTGPDHGFVESNFAGELRSWARSTGLGRVLTGEVGLYVRRNPDTVRGADVVYISNGRYAMPGVAPRATLTFLLSSSLKCCLQTTVGATS